MSVMWLLEVLFPELLLSSHMSRPWRKLSCIGVPLILESGVFAAYYTNIALIHNHSC
jgi:hypothetical protein